MKIPHGSAAVRAGSRHSIEHLRSVLDYDAQTGIFRWKIPTGRKGMTGKCAGSSSTRYVLIRLDGIYYPAHRVAWAFVTGEWPKEFIDHINGDSYDNRFTNLREADRKMNQHNQRKPQRGNTSGFLGVSKHGPSWRYQICCDGKGYQKSGFRTAEEAHQAYVAVKRVLHSDGCTL